MGLDAAQWTAIATSAAAVAAGGSVVAAIFSNGTSKSLAKIERDRRHSELTPKFDVFCVNIRPDNHELIIWLSGPSGLDKIDSLTISIRDNKRMFPSPSGRPTEEEVAKQIWAPRRFTPGVDGASVDGRSVPYSDLKLGDEVKFQLEKTPCPSWITYNGPNEWWEPMGISRSIKISISCINEDLGTWSVPWDIPLT